MEFRIVHFAREGNNKKKRQTTFMTTDTSASSPLVDIVRIHHTFDYKSGRSSNNVFVLCVGGNQPNCNFVETLLKVSTKLQQKCNSRVATSDFLSLYATRELQIA